MATANERLAQEQEYEKRGRLATAQAAHAFSRLLQRASANDTGQARRVAGFIATVIGRAKFDIYDLRALDVEISDDVLISIDAVRWGKGHLAELVPGGLARAEAVCREWGYTGAGAS